MVKKKSVLLIIVLLCCGLLLVCRKIKETSFGDNSEEVVSDRNIENEEAESQDVIAEDTAGEEERWEKGVNLPVDDMQKEEAEADCKKMMERISDLYVSAVKGNELNAAIPDKIIHQMVDKLKETGYPVVALETYFNMRNYRGFERFLNSCMDGRKGEAVIYKVYSNGGIGRDKYIFGGTHMYVLSARTAWNENNNPTKTDITYTRIKEWKYSKKGWFCYKFCVPEYPEVTEVVDGSCLIRVKPMSKEQRYFSKKYVLGLGYQGNNLLCSNWDSDHMQDIDYNGLYEYLYEMKYQKKFNPEDTPNGIPKGEFEDLIMEYLPVTVEDIRKYAVFDKKKQVYKWIRLGCFNYAPDYFGTSIPEVINIRKNKDGTVTLTVDAVCEMILCDDAVITHELTVAISEDGSFKYLGNKILYDGIKNIPDYQYRIHKKKSGQMFSLSIDDFIDSFNGYYNKDKGIDYIQPCSEWYLYEQDFGKYTGYMHYEFTADKKIWTLPTIIVYTPKNRKTIRELTVNFDDHSYTDRMYKQYEELCFYTLRVFFPELSERKIARLYKKLNKLAYENIFQNEQGFDSGNPPSHLYYENGVGVYPYFAYGECVRLCIVPVTSEVIRAYEKKGTLIHKIQ